jgi:plasmid maintenance system antidote protein VapI
VTTDEVLAMSPGMVAMLPDGAGESLAEEMDARGLTAGQVALASGLDPAVLDAVLASRVVITGDMSAAISRGLGRPHISDGFWLRLDAIIRRDKARFG